MQDDPQLGVDPVPTPTHLIVAAANEISPEDKALAVIHAMQARQAQFVRVSRRLTVLSTVGILLTLIVGFALVRVADNTNAIKVRDRALKAYCEQTNSYNAETREQFVTKFATAAPDPKALQDFADVAWPIRDCSGLVVPATSTTVAATVPP